MDDTDERGRQTDRQALGGGQRSNHIRSQAASQPDQISYFSITCFNHEEDEEEEKKRGLEIFLCQSVLRSFDKIRILNLNAEEGKRL